MSSRRASLYPSIHPSVHRRRMLCFLRAAFFSPRTANIPYITISSGSRQAHLICHYGRRIQSDPFLNPSEGKPLTESKDASQEITCSGAFYLCGESGATHTDKRLLLIICLCECTISGAVPFYSFGGCVRLNAFVLAGETFHVKWLGRENREKAPGCSWNSPFKYQKR